MDKSPKKVTTINERIEANVLYRVLGPRKAQYGTRSISATIAKMEAELRRLEAIERTVAAIDAYEANNVNSI